MAACLVAALWATSASAGTIPITLVIPPFAQISGLGDVVFGNVSVQTDAVSTQSVCIFSNSASRAYTVAATGSGSGTSFTLAGPQGQTVAYSVGWSGSSTNTSTTALASGSISAPFSGAASALACAGTTATSTLKITILASDLQTMTGGVAYTGALTLLIAPS